MISANTLRNCTNQYKYFTKFGTILSIIREDGNISRCAGKLSTSCHPRNYSTRIAWWAPNGILYFHVSVGMKSSHLCWSQFSTGNDDLDMSMGMMASILTRSDKVNRLRRFVLRRSVDSKITQTFRQRLERDRFHRLAVGWRLIQFTSWRDWLTAAWKQRHFPWKFLGNCSSPSWLIRIKILMKWQDSSCIASEEWFKYGTEYHLIACQIELTQILASERKFSTTR